MEDKTLTECLDKIDDVILYDYDIELKNLEYIRNYILEKNQINADVANILSYINFITE